ncbi:hypothetical protein B0H10DRAFT_2429883 [Mycena sp. CBHHK59/15]|nr:hypothetical protein B0H10DRAFT_2429883 [Mycena sp. CBHHK59/15]
MTKNQEIIAVNAATMFACMTSVVVNNCAQKKLNRAAETTSNLPPAEPDSDDTDDEDEDVTLSTGVPPKMRRDPWLTLHVLAADSATQLQLYGAAVAVGQPMFLLLFDNVNKMQRAWQQVLGRRDMLTSGTAATLIGLEDVTEEAMDSKPLLENLAAKKRKKLTVEQLLKDIDWDHLEGIGSEKTGIIHPPRTPLIDGLELYFQKDGPLKNIMFQELDEFSHTVYHRYMCNDAYEDAQGHYPRDPKIHGPPAPPSAPVPAPVPTEPSTAGLDSEEEEDTDADPVFLSTESAATKRGKEGNIGRVFEIIKVLRFSFWGAGSTNYGNEMLELACNFLYEFPPALQDAVLNNYLVNTTGLFGHWLELDLLQEHFNFWIKRLFNSKSHSFDSKHLSEAVGLNTHGFSAIRDQFPGIFGFKKTDGTHRKADTTNDLNALGVHFRDDYIMQYVAGRNGHVVPNEFYGGIDILAGGKLDEFLERTTRDGTAVQPEGEPVLGEEGEECLPANPITSGTQGITNLTQFNLGE